MVQLVRHCWWSTSTTPEVWITCGENSWRSFRYTQLSYQSFNDFVRVVSQQLCLWVSRVDLELSLFLYGNEIHHQQGTCHDIWRTWASGNWSSNCWFIGVDWISHSSILLINFQLSIWYGSLFINWRHEIVGSTFGCTASDVSHSHVYLTMLFFFRMALFVIENLYGCFSIDRPKTLYYAVPLLSLSLLWFSLTMIPSYKTQRALLLLLCNLVLADMTLNLMLHNMTGRKFNPMV